jgi:hypothetical protein
MEAEDVFLCFYLFILIFLSRFYLTFFILFYPYLSSQEESFLIVIPNCASPELRFGSTLSFSLRSRGPIERRSCKITIFFRAFRGSTLHLK